MAGGGGGHIYEAYVSTALNKCSVMSHFDHGDVFKALDGIIFNLDCHSWFLSETAIY